MVTYKTMFGYSRFYVKSNSHLCNNNLGPDYLDKYTNEDVEKMIVKANMKVAKAWKNGDVRIEEIWPIVAEIDDGKILYHGSFNRDVPERQLKEMLRHYLGEDRKINITVNK